VNIEHGKSATIGRSYPQLHFWLIVPEIKKIFAFICGYNIFIRYICIQNLTIQIQNGFKLKQTFHWTIIKQFRQSEFERMNGRIS